MRPSSIRFGFCLAIAVTAAAIADPLVEFASNAGWFGPGSFTDRSNLDVVPALAAGCALLLLYFARKARILVAKSLPHRDVATLMPLVFALQILVLYAMETAEQVAVYGHVLGPTLWLGGPVLASLTLHAICCIAVTIWVARSSRCLAETTLRVIRLIRAIATLAADSAGTVKLRPTAEPCFDKLAPVLSRIGARAPPPLRS